MRHQLEWMWRVSHSGLLIVGLCGAVVFAVLGGVQVANAADWPCYRGPNKDGHTTDTISKWPTELWRAKVGQGYSQVVVSEGRVYTMGWSNNHDYVYCYSESATGTNPTVSWVASYSYDGSADNGYPGTRSTPTVDGNEVYTYSADGQLNCFNKITGSNIWHRNVAVGRPTWGFGSSPLVESNNVIVNAGGDCIAIDKSTSLTNWSSTGSAGYCSPYAVTVGGQRTVVFHSGSKVAGVNPADGSELWYFTYINPTWPGGLVSPIIYNNQIWASEANGMGQAGFKIMNLGSGQLTAGAWTNTTCSSGANSSVLKDGYIYGLVRRGAFTGLGCVEFSTGNIMWISTNAASTRFGLLSGIVVAGDQVVIMTGTDNNYDGSGTTIGNGYLIVASATPSGYNELYRTNLFSSGSTWTSPTVSNGKLYVRNVGGTLICYDVGTTPAPGGTNVPPAEWILHYYPGTDSNQYAAVAASDTDHDGGTAWQEYVSGTDPTSSGNCLRVGIVMSDIGKILVSLPTLPATGIGYSNVTRYYNLETVTGLLNGVWQGVSGVMNITGNNSTVIYTNATPSSAGFYRIKTWLQ